MTTIRYAVVGTVTDQDLSVLHFANTQDNNRLYGEAMLNAEVDCDTRLVFKRSVSGNYLVIVAPQGTSRFDVVRIAGYVNGYVRAVKVAGNAFKSMLAIERAEND